MLKLLTFSVLPRVTFGLGLQVQVKSGYNTEVVTAKINELSLNNPKKQTILIGGGGGLGLATAEHLLNSKQYNVAVLDINTEKAEALSPEILAIQCDITDEEAVEVAVKKTVEKFGQLDIALASQGSFTPSMLDGLPLDQLERTMNVHFYGAINLAKHAVAAMKTNTPNPDKENQRGVLIFTSSIIADEGTVSTLTYAAAKGALKAIVTPIARELGHLGIRANCIAPGTMNTEIMKIVSPEARQNLMDATPLGEIGNPKYYALLVNQIIDNAWVTGQHFRLDGGQTSPHDPKAVGSMTDVVNYVRGLEASAEVPASDDDLVLVERLFRERMARIDAVELENYMKTATDDHHFRFYMAGLGDQPIAQADNRADATQVVAGFATGKKAGDWWHVFTNMKLEKVAKHKEDGKEVQGGEDADSSEVKTDIQLTTDFMMVEMRVPGDISKGIKSGAYGKINARWVRPVGLGKDKKMKDWKISRYIVQANPPPTDVGPSSDVKAMEE